MQRIGILLYLIMAVSCLKKYSLLSPLAIQAAVYRNLTTTGNELDRVMKLRKVHSPAISSFVLSNKIKQSTEQVPLESDVRSSGLGESKVNVKHFTQFVYEGAQIYVYDAKTNEEYTDPKMWSFYYVPILEPVRTRPDHSLAWVHKNEVRIQLALGTPEVEKAARRAIAQRYDGETASNYSEFWVVAPLMIDSLNSYIVTSTSTPIEGVSPYHLVNPNMLIITMRFICTTEDLAKSVMRKLLDGDYEIEVAFMFAGWWGIKENSISVTGNQLKAVLSKTIADGAGTNNTYIHRNQASKFIGRYVSNVRTLIYMENPNTNFSELTADLPARFISLFQQGMESAEQAKIDAKAYDQVWDSSDLNPDRITSELNKMFTYNQTETELHNHDDKYFNYNSDWKQSVSVGTSFSTSACVYGKFGCASTGVSVNVDVSQEHQQSETTHDIHSSSEIRRELYQQSMEVAWEGEKFVPKSFNVFKLIDVADHLQVAVVNKQLFAEKSNGAVIRKVNLDAFITAITAETPLIGEIRLYSAGGVAPWPWLLCDGAAVSRVVHKRLFSVIGTIYGVGDGSTTFNVPDFRGRFPLGADQSNLNSNIAQQLGARGGQVMHTLTLDQMPSHAHSAGSYMTSAAGDHSHLYDDPGHNHGGRTGSSPYSEGTMTFHTPKGGRGNDHGSHSHEISMDKTNITIRSAGIHSHSIIGQSSTAGNGRGFSILNPYQTVNYIIYSN